MTTTDSVSSEDWPRCAVLVGESDDRCHGVQLAGVDRCLAHLDAAELATFLSELFPGADLDVRGTTLDSELLIRLMQAFTPTGSPASRAQLGHADFTGATFTQNSYFTGAAFTQGASFRRATFALDACFGNATFTEVGDFTGASFAQNAYFTGATFTQGASFRRASFTLDAYFGDATFTESAYFTGAGFTQNAYFTGATFTQGASFGSATFTEDACFIDATFTTCERLGPLTAGQLDVRGAQFGVAVVVEAAAGEVSCQRARFSGGVELRVRHGRVGLAEVLLGAASSLGPSVSAHAGEAQVESWREMNGSLDDRPVLTSLRGTDVSELALTDVDLRWCRFAGAHHLDKLRIEATVRSRGRRGTAGSGGVPDGK
ncbi:pentapeptide repeat-containing protein [Amycolatopsis eburnea]|uniref:Pentapeptide repeat-containing protein n=1 Tax=Amycolatopsis eburnea TaxID=2267691 RepID=A0A3R9FEY9_9PSEU|nr:pentapeptide repeat-containing protein [Amycolatopsis eburnea]RSD07966.1 pentapeptide repeat-containing protein [Amycolatopsis eburnea]